jgi:hypothetical protein
LLETETNEHNLAGITKAIKALWPKHAGLADIDEVWIADAVSQESFDIRFCKVSPCDVPQRVFVRGTLTTKDSIPLGKMSFLLREPMTAVMRGRSIGGMFVGRGFSRDIKGPYQRGFSP